MTSAVLEALSGNLERIGSELTFYSVLSESLAEKYRDDPKALQEYDRRAKRATYCNAIVGCYGLIEQTVDTVMISVAESYKDLYARFGDIPEPIRGHHRDLVLQCLRDGERARTRSKIEEKVAINALGRSPDDPARLLAPVFTLSTANYRQPYVQSLFHRVGVDIAVGLTRNEPVAELGKAGFATYESFIEDLVQRRNDLAHSYGDDDMLDPDLLGTYMEIVGAFLTAVVRSADASVIAKLCNIRLHPIGTVAQTWTGRIGVRLDYGTLTVGDRLLILKDDWSTSHLVEELRSEGLSYEQVSFEKDVINVSAKVQNVPSHAENAVAYVLSGVWEEFWPPDEK